MKRILLAISLLFISSLIFSCGTAEEKKGESDTTSVEQKEPTKEVKTWSYEENTDEMTGETSKFAVLRCDKPAVAENGDGISLMIVITDNKSAQLLSDRLITSKNRNELTNHRGGHAKFEVKFDDGNIESFNVSRKADDTNCFMVRIDNASEFINKCKTAKKIVIRTTPLVLFGTLTYTFTVDEPLKTE